MNHGKFVVSLDFEIIWGVRDKKDIESYYTQNLLGVHQVIPALLDLFDRYQINATFSTVGLLFFETKKDLLQHLPPKKPGYTNQNLSPYHTELDKLGDDYTTDLLHFAPKLIEQIKQHPNQEIGTHTFCHYYCLEEGQSIDEFKADLQAAIRIAEERQIKMTSLIFPRNQFNNEYLDVCKDLGIICYRGNEHSWLYKPRQKQNESITRRAFRKMDAYINLSGHNCYSDEMMSASFPINIPSSRLLRPFSPKLKTLEWLRLSRRKKDMTYAAKNKLTFHLWWHPHNFGIHQSENLSFLSRILEHYQLLNERYGFQSYTMSSLANKLLHP